MNIKLTIRQKILYYILGSAFVIFTFVFFFESTTSRRLAYDQAIKLTNSYAKQYALNIEGWLNQDFAVTRTLAAAFMEYKQMPFDQWQKLIYPMYNRVIQTTPHIDAYWDSWELSNLDSTWALPYGRYFYIVYKQDGVYKTKAEMRSLTGDPETYKEMKSAAQEIVVEPYISELQLGQMMTTLSAPLLENGKFIGLIGADLILTRFQNLVNTIKPYPQSYAFLLSNKGVFIAHPDSSIFKKNITEVLPDFNSKYNILTQIQKGKSFNFVDQNEKGEKLYYTFEPIKIGNTLTPWSIGIAVPISDIMAKANQSYNTSFLIGLIGLIIAILIAYLVSNNITVPIKKITHILNEFAKGKIVNIDVKTSSNDEIGQMIKAMNASLEGVSHKTSFAREIGSGNLNIELPLLSDDDLLGKSLMEMRDNLRKALEEEEKRKIEEEKKRWTNEGMTKFGEILRQNNNNLTLLSQELIKNLVWYLNASVGGIFVLNENKETGDKTFDMIAMFAYDRNRIMKRSYHFAEGLIGACAAERDAIILKEVPQDYIEITSGLGGTNPNYIIVVPLIFEDEVMGVIEIASLQVLKEHEVQFLKDIAKSIASTLHTVKINTLTAELLMKSKEQAEMMAAQEEEMRQNMEELQATQEEAARKTLELEGLVNALNTAAFIMEYDAKGYVISINEGYLNFMGVNREEIIGLHHSDNLILSVSEKTSYDKMWNDILKGNTRKRKVRIKVKGQEHLLLETYTPIFDHGGHLFKILKIAMDITNI